MAKKKTQAKVKKTKKFKAPSFKLSNQQKLVFGSLLIILGFLLFIAFISFFFTGKADQSALTEIGSRDFEYNNWTSQFGAWLSDFFIQRGFGIASFVFSGLIFLSGVYVLLNLNKSKLGKHWFWGTLIVIWLSIFFGFFADKNDLLGGTIGFEINSALQYYIGKIGTILLLIFGLITYLATRFKVSVESFKRVFKKAKKEINEEIEEFKGEFIPLDNDLTAEAEDIKSAFEVPLDNPEPSLTNQSTKTESKKDPIKVEVKKEPVEALAMEVEQVAEEV